MRKLDLAFRAINRGFAERNRKADPGVKQLIASAKFPAFRRKYLASSFTRPANPLVRSRFIIIPREGCTGKAAAHSD